MDSVPITQFVAQTLTNHLEKNTKKWKHQRGIRSSTDFFFFDLKTKTYKQNGTNLSCLFTEKQWGFKNLFLSEQQNVFVVGFGDVPLEKGLMVLLFWKKVILLRNPCEVSPLRNVLDFFFPLYKVYLKTLIFFVRKMTKGHNKSPVILTKIKALLFVQEQSWNLLSWWRLARGVVLHVRLVPTVHQQKQNYILMLCPFVHHLSASQLHQDPKFVSKAQTRR